MYPPRIGQFRDLLQQWVLGQQMMSLLSPTSYEALVWSYEYVWRCEWQEMVNCGNELSDLAEPHMVNGQDIFIHAQEVNNGDHHR